MTQEIRELIDRILSSYDEMDRRFTAAGGLGSLLSLYEQVRRELAGYSRTRVAERVGIKPGTIEGWELGRVEKPPIHDVLRLAHFLRIPSDEIEAAVFEDSEVVPPEEEGPDVSDRRRRRTGACDPPSSTCL